MTIHNTLASSSSTQAVVGIVIIVVVIALAMATRFWPQYNAKIREMCLWNKARDNENESFRNGNNTNKHDV